MGYFACLGLGFGEQGLRFWRDGRGGIEGGKRKEEGVYVDLVAEDVEDVLWRVKRLLVLACVRWFLRYSVMVQLTIQLTMHLSFVSFTSE